MKFLLFIVFYACSAFCQPPEGNFLKAALFTFFYKNTQAVCAGCEDSMREGDERVKDCRNCESEQRERPRSVKFSQDGSFLAVRNFSRTIHLYEVKKHEKNNNESPLSQEQIISEPNQNIMSMEFTPFSPEENAGFLAYGTDSGYLYFHPLKENAERSIYKMHESYINDIDFSKDGKYMASVSSDKTMKIIQWNKFVPGGSLRRTDMELSGSGKQVKFSPDSKTAAVATFSDMSIIDFETKNILHQFPDPDSEYRRKLTSVNFTKDGIYLTVGRQGCNLQLHELNSGEKLEFEGTNGQRVLSQKDIELNNDSSLVAVSAIQPRSCAHLYRLNRTADEGKLEPDLTQTIKHLRGPEDYWWNKHYIPKDFDWGRDELPENMISQKYKQIHHIKFSPDNNFLATGDENGEVKIFQKNQDSDNYSLVYTTRKGESKADAHYSGINDLAFSPDNSLLAIASERNFRLISGIKERIKWLTCCLPRCFKSNAD